MILMSRFMRLFEASRGQIRAFWASSHTVSLWAIPAAQSGSVVGSPTIAPSALRRKSEAGWKTGWPDGSSCGVPASLAPGASQPAGDWGERPERRYFRFGVGETGSFGRCELLPSVTWLSGPLIAHHPPSSFRRRHGRTAAYVLFHCLPDYRGHFVLRRLAFFQVQIADAA